MQEPPDIAALFEPAQCMTVIEAAHELKRDPSRVRALIAAGLLRADKIDGRWLVHCDSLVARRRHTPPVGRPIATRNAWALMLEISGEPVPIPILPAIRERLLETLLEQGFRTIRGRFQRRARVYRLRAQAGVPLALRSHPAVVLTGTSAAETVGVTLAPTDTADAYILSSELDALRREHKLRVAPTMAQCNVILRAIDARAWMLEDRPVAPRAAVAVDLASSPDPPVSRAGLKVIDKLDQEMRERLRA